MTTRCPGEPALVAFHRGDLPETELDGVADHLDGCPACAARLARLDRDTDPVLDALRDPPPAGATPPGYEVHECVGAGGMGVVHRATDRRLGRTVALKWLRAGDVDDVARFRGEAEAAARLQHPNIVSVYEVGEHRGRPYLALEFVPGGSLAARTGPQPAAVAARLVGRLARAVQHAHDRGVVHRDLKPANVMLRPPDGAGRDVALSECEPKLTDFGIAKRLDRAGATQTGAVLGTPGYMAPEQAAGRAVGPACDVYGLGAILYALLTGRPPFQGDDATDTLRRVGQEDPVPPSRLAACPRDLETVVLKCLEKESARRYGSAAALADDLDRFVAGRPVLARPLPAWASAWKWARRHPATAAAAAVAQVALVLLAGGAWWYTGRLQAALSRARDAEERADASARATRGAYRELVTQVREQLRGLPGTRAARQKLLEAAVAGMANVAQSGGGPVAGRADAHLLLAELHWDLGRVPEAVAECERCRDAAGAALAADPADTDAMNCKSLALRLQGLATMRRGQPADASALLDEAVALAAAWHAADPTDARARRAVVANNLMLGHAHQWAGRLAEADKPLHAARTAAEAWLADDPANRDARGLLAQTLSHLGQSAQARGDEAGTRQFYERALAEAEAVGADDPPARRNRLAGHANLAEVCQALGDTAAARRHASSAIQLARVAAAADPDDVQGQIDLMHALRGAGFLEQDDLCHAAAVPFFEEAAAIVRNMRNRGGSADRAAETLNWLPVIEERLAACRLAPKELTDPAATAGQPYAVALELARTRVGLLLRAGRFDEAATAAGRFDGFHPVDAEGWYCLASVCARTVGMFAPTAAATDPAVGRLAARGVEALGRAHDLGHPRVRAPWGTGTEFKSLRSHPAYAAEEGRRSPKPP